MGNVYFVKVISERDVKAKDVVESTTLLLSRVLIVTNIFTLSMPSIINTLSLLSRVDEWQHSVIVKGICFLKVLDVNRVSLVLSRVLDPEEVPLRVRIGVIIWLQVEVILVFAYLDRSSKISTFKSGFKH